MDNVQQISEIITEPWPEIKTPFGISTFCVEGKFHIGISWHVPSRNDGWHVSVYPHCNCGEEKTDEVPPEVFKPEIMKILERINVPMYPAGQSSVGSWHWDEVSL